MTLESGNRGTGPASCPPALHAGAGGASPSGSVCARPGSFLLALMALLLCSCAGSRGPALYEATARIAIEDRPSTGTVLLARREVPWREVVLTERVPLAPAAAPDARQPAGQTPGLRVARERLEARTLLESKIREKAGALPATDPIPGAERGRSVAELAEREPAVRASLEELVSRGIEERFVRVDRSVSDFVEGSARLGPLADAVLAAGGGRRVDDTDLERRAADAAISKARAQLLEALSRHPVKGSANLGAWARASAGNALAYERLTREIRIESSGPEPTPKGRDWVVKLSLPKERVEAAIAPPARRKPADAGRTGIGR